MSDYLMSFDIMKEMATRVCGRYIAWANQATDPAVKRHWMNQASQVTQGVQQVRAHDVEAIAAKREELRQLFRSMPVEAPAVAA